MPIETKTWWALLCALACLNIFLWLVSARSLQKTAPPEGVLRLRRLHLVLAGGYVFGCAFRSVFPVFDIPRLALTDTVLSSAFVGRSVATVAELCFATQWALLLGEVAKAADDRKIRRNANVIVPLIIVAELFSWHSVLTTSNLGHVIEETLWGICAVLVTISLVSVWSRCEERFRFALALACSVVASYAAYMFLQDVPMYLERWQAEAAMQHRALGLWPGAADALTRWVVTPQWDAWRGEAAWMTLYFSVGVWVSISMVYLPARGPLIKRQGAGRSARGMAASSAN